MSNGQRVINDLKIPRRSIEKVIEHIDIMKKRIKRMQ
ncbi:MAG: hypothetical protein JWQ40_2413 [Segetibacter sp.]|nr:hypothetical protein [Segetibacter sp.]